MLSRIDPISGLLKPISFILAHQAMRSAGTVSRVANYVDDFYNVGVDIYTAAKNYATRGNDPDAANHGANDIMGIFGEVSISQARGNSFLPEY